MSQNVPLSKRTILRLPKIKQGLRDGLNYNQIGASCGVTEKTIDRDMNAWVASGLFEKWLITEFVQIHYHMKDANISKVYDNLSRIVARMVTQKKEITEDIYQETRIVWQDERKNSNDKVHAP